MREKAKQILFQKLPVAVVAVILSFIIFNMMSTPAFVELIKLKNIAGAC